MFFNHVKEYLTSISLPILKTNFSNSTQGLLRSCYTLVQSKVEMLKSYTITIDGFYESFLPVEKQLIPKNFWRAGLTSANQLSPFRQKGWIDRHWLARPSKGHNAKIFWCINCFSTCKNTVFRIKCKCNHTFSSWFRSIIMSLAMSIY